MPIPAPVSHAQAVAPVWACGSCGEGLEGACGAPGPQCRIDPEYVTHHLEAAGSTLLAMRGRSPFPREPGCAWPDVLHEAIEAYGYTPSEYRQPIPDAAAITRMDRTFMWLGYIPDRRFVLRRIVAARALTNPHTGRALLHWRAIGKMLRCSHEACRVWHQAGIGLIVEGLRG